jgi:hypothetical protein
MPLAQAGKATLAVPALNQAHWTVSAVVPLHRIELAVVAAHARRIAARAFKSRRARAVIFGVAADVGIAEEAVVVKSELAVERAVGAQTPAGIGILAGNVYARHSIIFVAPADDPPAIGIAAVAVGRRGIGDNGDAGAREAVGRDILDADLGVRADAVEIARP